MKRKVFATMIALMMSAVMLVGCGSSNDDLAAYNVDDGPAIPDDSETENMVGATNQYINEQGEILTQAPNDGSIGKSDDIASGEEDIAFGHVPEEDIVPWDEMGDEETKKAPTEVGEAKGIMILQVDYRTGTPSFIVSAINPDTGDYHIVSSFVFEHAARINETEFIIEPAHQTARSSNYRGLFNDDFTLMAATKTFLSNEAKHAGWIDQSGEFFDLTLALNEQAQSDFDATEIYAPIGFTDDGNFVYIHPDGRYDSTYHVVALTEIAPGASHEITADDRYIMDYYASDAWKWASTCYPSCWVNEDQFLTTMGSGTGGTVCALATISGRSMQPLVPAESQTSWSPVVGPDGTSVAFLAAPIQGTDQPSIYLTDIGGINSPTKLETSYSPTFRKDGFNNIPLAISISQYYASILEWR